MDALLNALVARDLQQQQQMEHNKREYATATRPDGTVETIRGDAHSAPLPQGELLNVVHNHPGGSSLSLGDLLLLARVGRMEAVGKQSYVARKGANYGDFQKQYDAVSKRVASDLAKRRAIRGYDSGPTQEELINRELAKLGVIEYEERPISKSKK